jgi:TPR repeat protein
MRVRAATQGDPSMFKIRLAAAAFAIASAHAAVADALPSLTDAQQAYHQGQYRRSLALFERLAASRDAEAAECAGFMLLTGETMYGAQVQRDTERAKRYLLQAAGSGRTAAGFLLNLIERTD